MRPPDDEWCAPPFTSLSDWLARDLPAPDFMLGELLSTTSRLMLVGPTGLGKTNFAMAISMSVAAGDNFLHWNAREGPRRVLFIDGEMSNRLLKRRLEDATRRAGCIPNGFHALSRDDAPDMPPLDSPAGQRYVNRVIEHLGGADLTVFDNLQASRSLINQ